ncbi:MAG: hypothetical protein P8175_15375 [Deltaproteobacteria bacterium]
MSETVQIIFGFLVLIAVYILTRYILLWRIRRSSMVVIKDLERRKALDPVSSAELPYAESSFFRFGMRDFRPKALEGLVEHGIVGKTSNGRYFLMKKIRDLEAEGVRP